MEQQQPEKRPGLAPSLGLGFGTALLFTGLGVSLFIQGAMGVLLTGLETFALGVIGTLARRGMPKRLKISASLGALAGIVAAILLIRWQSLSLHRAGNLEAMFLAPVGLVLGRVFCSTQPGKQMQAWARATFSDARETAAYQAGEQIPEIWVARSADGKYLVIDRSIQPGNASEYIYYYDPMEKRFDRLRRADARKDLKVVDLVEVKLSSIQAYEGWKESIGEAALRETVAGMEKPP